MRVIGLLLLLISLKCFAQATPEGLWMSFDDDGKTPTALVRISQSRGQFVGRIEKILDGSSDSICSKCADDRKINRSLG